jgi:voltage-gated sodium channel
MKNARSAVLTMRETAEPAAPGLANTRRRIGEWIDTPRIQRGIIALVVLNAITLGLETVPAVLREAGWLLGLLDRALLSVFVMEIALKLFAHGGRFFRSGWNVFDLIVIGIALVPSTGALSVFRALRVLRILRVVSAIPKLRAVVESLVRSLPGMGAISILLVIFFYVFSVVATKLFGADFPQWFGTLWVSAFSLFQIMTLEGWADIAREVMPTYPGAWLFFVAFILLSTFTVLNLFIGLIVKAMEEPIGKDSQAVPATREDIETLRREIARLRVIDRPRGRGYRRKGPSAPPR